MKHKLSRRSIAALTLGFPVATVTAATVAVAVSGMVATEELRADAEWNRQHTPTAFEICAVSAMKSHHEQAVRMGDIMASSWETRSEDAEYAAYISTAQVTEIATMNNWLSAWNIATVSSPVDLGHGSHAQGTVTDTAESGASSCASTPMSGMATPAQLEALAAATGSTQKSLFLSLMISHHEGAIAMARITLESATNPYVLSSARHTVTEQSLEIEQLRSMQQ